MLDIMFKVYLRNWVSVMIFKLWVYCNNFFLVNDFFFVIVLFIYCLFVSVGERLGVCWFFLEFFD